MTYPSFFTQIPTITVHDGLAQLLGANSDGLIEYSYTDAVKAAGHSCPTVAGAWLMTVTALKQLYGNDTPERGGIEVSFRQAAADGTTGVVATVVSLITGAATEGGFKGLRGQHVRSNLMRFNQAIDGEIRFTRQDNKEHVDVSFDASIVPAEPEMFKQLMTALDDIDSESSRAFANNWQDRVRRLFDEANNPQLVIIH